MSHLPVNYILNKTPVSVKDYGAIGDGITNDTVAIQAAFAASANIYFPSGTYFIQSSTTLGDTNKVWYFGGGKLLLGSGITLTIKGTINASSKSQIFDYVSEASTIRFGDGTNGLQKQTHIYPEWWGAIGDNSTDDTVALRRMFKISSTIDNPNHALFTSGKVYKITDQVLVGTPGVSGNSWVITGYGAAIQAHGTTGIAIKLGQYTGVPANDCKLYILKWHGLGLGRSTNDISGTSKGLTFASCDFGNIHAASFGGFAYSITNTEEGGNSNHFFNCSVGGGLSCVRLGGGHGAINFNAWSWVGGKVQEAQIAFDINGSATFSIRDPDCSVLTQSAVKLSGCSEWNIKFYSEAIGRLGSDLFGLPLPTADAAVLDLISSSCGSAINCRINPAGGVIADDLAYGIRLSDCDHISIQGGIYQRGKIADIRIEHNCGSNIIIDETNRLEFYVTNGVRKIRISDARNGRGIPIPILTQDYQRPLVENTFGTLKNIFVSPDDYNHPSWILSGGAIINGTTLAPDGISQAQIVEFPNTETVGTPIAALNATNVETGESLDGKYAILRYWWKPISILESGTGLQTFKSELRRNTFDSNSRATTGTFINNGYCDGYGPWQFEEHIYILPNKVPNDSSMSHLFFEAIDDALSIAFWHMQLFITDDLSKFVSSNTPQLATAELPGVISALDKQTLDAIAPIRIRNRSREISSSDLISLAPGVKTAIFNIGSGLPSGSRPLGFSVTLSEPVVIPGSTFITLDIGTTSDDDALVSSADIKSSPVDGQASSMPFGIAPFKPLDGYQLITTISSDVNLNTATRGNIISEVIYATKTPSTLFEPTDLHGCTLWLPNDIGAMTIVSEAVSVWKDRSGNGHNYIQTTPANRPKLLRTNGINNQPTLWFDSSTSWLTCPDNITNMIGAFGTPGFSIYTLFKTYHVVTNFDAPNGWYNNDTIWNDEFGFIGMTARTRNNGELLLGTYSGVDVDAIIIPYQIGMPLVLSWRFNGIATQGYRINDNAEVNTTRTIALFTGLQRIGKNGDVNTAYIGMQMAEHIMFNRKLTDTEDALVRARLLQLGGIS